MAAGEAMLAQTAVEGGEHPAPGTNQSEPSSRVSPPRKRSTHKGDGRTKLIAALTKYHQYADDGCLNPAPIGNNELARLADVSPSTASLFFDKEFEGHDKYCVVCRDVGRLVDSLKALNGDFSPHDLYGRRPVGEDHPDAD
jgi:hypothetical protein